MVMCSKGGRNTPVSIVLHDTGKSKADGQHWTSRSRFAAGNVENLSTTVSRYNLGASSYLFQNRSFIGTHVETYQ